MKKFTLIINLTILIFCLQGQYNLSIAQCTNPVNVSDSLEFERIRREIYWDEYEWKDTLGECRIAYLGFWFVLPENLNFPFLKELKYVPEGSISNLIELQSLPNLQKITIGDAIIDKDIIISDLPQLMELSFSGSSVRNTGSITLQNLPNLNGFEPPSLSSEISAQDIFIGDFPGLKKMSWNGEFIPNISNFPALEDLTINGSYNHYTNTNNHTVAEIHSFSNFPALKKLTIGRHEFENSMSNFDQLQNLEEIDIQWNVLSGPIPNFNNPLLKSIRLSYNNLDGPIPDFNNIPLLETLELFQNNLTGTIPNFENIPLLTTLYLSGNQLTGAIPNFDNLPVLNDLYICANSNENEFTGPIPALENCPLLDLDDIDFSCVGPTPENNGNPVSESDSLVIVNFYQATNGDNWDVSEGWLTRNLDAWWGIDLLDTLGEKRVNKMLIRGIPDAVSLPALNLPFLEELILDYNNFTDNIPDISNLTNLKVLNLAANNFTGSLPDLSNLTQLEEINLSQNELEDVVTDYPNQPNLKILDVSGNQLTGEIPSLDSNPELRQLNISGNLLAGTIPDFQNVPNLEYLNVSGNQLAGTIPDFTSLPNLHTLNVADNQLTGDLPNFSNLSALQSLFVQGNQLTGRVPNFGNLASLQELVVCDNNFEGTPPNFSFSPSLNVDAIDFSCLQSAKVNGYVYYDTNENCVYDDGDITIPNGLISINNGTNYQPVDEDGYYEIALEVGANLITFIQTSPLWQSTCGDTHTITSVTINDITEIDFANQPTIDCTQLTVDIGTPFLRRCFTNTYTVEYCNQGNQPAADAYIEIDFEQEIIPLSASIPYQESDNLFTFQLGEVGIGECGSFTVVDSVACDAPLSSTGCVEAHIYPDDFCFVPATWDGANLAINAFCMDNDSVQFVIENLGNDMLNPSIYKMYEEDVLYVQGEVTLPEGATKVLSYPANGSTYRVAVEQTPGHPSLDDAQAFFEFCGDGNFSTGFINSQLLPDGDPFVDMDCEEIIGSYDPNDKLVTPAGVGDRYDVYEDDGLTYKIRFQNTGNDTAFTVVLVDTLDTEHLDISTLEVLNSSHNYTLSIEDAQILTFTFNDILLVDSTANEQASHGFVTFKINQNTTNEIGDIIMNKAYIYFDYNEAIVTPTVFNTVAELRLAANVESIPLPVGIELETGNHLFAKVYPNPVSDVFYIELPSETLHKYTNLQIEIYNTNGQVVTAHYLNRTQQSIDVTAFNNGIFYYKIFSDAAMLANGKLLVQ